MLHKLPARARRAAPLEEEFSDVLVTVGVHSPKFEHEADPVALAAAVDRYDIKHPVLDDPELTTWQAYTARAWPTLVVIDPEGYIVAHLSGEGHVQGLISLVRELVAEHEKKVPCTVATAPMYPDPKPREHSLFRGRLLNSPQSSDPKPVRHRLTHLPGVRHRQAPRPAGCRRPQHCAGNLRRGEGGDKGYADGTGTTARFNEPQGLALVPAELREKLGYDVLITDTVNHRLRSLNLRTGEVRTLAGNGVQRVIDGDNAVTGNANHIPADAPATAIALSSPWDAVYSREAGQFVIAMAGTHQLFGYDPVSETVSIFAGAGVEGLQDGTAEDAWFAQPSGIIEARDGSLWVACSETSGLRHVTFTRDDHGHQSVQVTSAVGLGLFDFGFVDGDSQTSRMQHPLGLAELPDGSIAVADTYNGAIRRWDPVVKELSTLQRGLAEPADLLVEHSPGENPRLIIVETNAHQLVRAAIPAQAQKWTKARSQPPGPPRNSPAEPSNLPRGLPCRPGRNSIPAGETRPS